MKTINNMVEYYNLQVHRSHLFLCNVLIMCFILRIADREKINNPNMRSSSATSNVTKFPLKNEYNSNVQTKSSSTIVFPNSGDGKIPRIGNNKLIPDPHVIEKCSMNGSFCTKVDNYPR